MEYYKRKQFIIQIENIIDFNQTMLNNNEICEAEFEELQQEAFKEYKKQCRLLTVCVVPTTDIIANDDVKIVIMN